MGKSFILLLGIIAIPIKTLYGHGDIHEKIDRITVLIQEYPDSAALYYKRGELYHYHGEFKQALSDYNKVKKLDPVIEKVNLSIAKLCLEHDSTSLGLRYVNIYLQSNPKHVSALSTRADLYMVLENYVRAIEDYRKMIQYSVQCLPENFLKISSAILQQDSSNYDEAIKWLDEGSKKLGFLIAFEERAIGLEIQRDNWAGAVYRIDYVLQHVERREFWLVYKADILVKANQQEQALCLYNTALETIKQLPVSKQNAESVEKLESRIFDGIKSCN